MGEVTPEMVENATAFVAELKRYSPLSLGSVATVLVAQDDIEALSALLDSWERRGDTINASSMAGESVASIRIRELERSLAEARAELEQLSKWADGLISETQRLQGVETQLSEAREKLAKVVRLVDVIRRANEPCDAEDGYCVHCACVEALAAAKLE